MTQQRRLTNEEFIDVLTHEMAIAWADEISTGPETEEERASIDRLDRMARSLIAELRRKAFAELCRNRPEVVRRPIPARILAMTRDELVRQLRRLELGAPVTLQAAFRQLDQLELDDVRAMLTDLEDALGAAR